MDRLVVHLKNGEIAKGYSADFSPEGNSFHMIAVNDPLCREEVRLENLKAVFFVKDFEGDFLRIDSNDFTETSASGKHIVVSFYDGELFFGTSETVDREKTGFYILPIDQKSNIVRAFVINSFIESVNFVE